MNPFIKQFQEYISSHPLQYGCGDIQSLSDLLYNVYVEHNPIDSAEIRASFSELGPILEQLTDIDTDHVFNVICRLCAQHEEAAFLQGMRVGAQVILELTILESDSQLQTCRSWS